MYKLMIKKRNSEEWQVADFGKDTPSMTFTIHDISAFDKRQSNYSQRLKLPLTDNNKRIFDFITAPNYNGTIQKDYLDARLFVNGQTLLGNGGVLSVIGVNDSAIEVCLLSSAKDFFTKLEAIVFENTDILGTPRLPATDFSQGVEQVTDETDFVFASYANSTGVYNSNNTDKDDKGYIRYGLPMLRVCHNYEGGASGLIPRLCSSLGYSFQSDINFTDLCLSLCDRKANSGINGTIPKELTSLSVDKSSPWSNQADNTLIITELPETKYYFLFEAESAPGNSIIDDLNSFSMTFKLYPDAAYTDSSSQVNGSFYNKDKSFSNWQKAENGNYIKKFVYLPEEAKTYYTNENGKWVYNATHYGVGAVNPNNVRVLLGIGRSSLSYHFRGNASIRFSIIYASATDGVAVTGTPINVAKSLGWKNGREAMNNLCNIFGAIVRVDETTKTFYFNSLSTIINNKGNAKDWSDKLLKGVAQTFVIGKFAQRSTIALEQNSITNNLSQADIRIDNKTISEQKEVLKVPLESPFSNRILQKNGEFVVAKAPTMAKVDQSLETPKVTKCYEANDILSLYKGYETMLNNGFIIDVELMLTDLDVATLDFFAPVYLRQYGRFFYINEIKNFVSGKPTEATLIAI